MDWFVVKVSLEVHNLKKRMIRMKDLEHFFFQHTLVCANGFLTWNIFYFYFLWLRPKEKGLTKDRAYGLRILKSSIFQRRLLMTIITII